MEPNCNLVLSERKTKKPLFTTTTTGRGTNCKAVLQRDGNFVVRNGQKQLIWSTRTLSPGKGPFRLTLFNNGNLVLFHKKNCKWASKSCPLPRKFKGKSKRKVIKKN
jgi:hypothetical protein